MIDKDYVEKSIELAKAGLPADLPIVAGLSSNKVRRLIHWLCKPAGTNYLEIGTHRGSTFIPALWENLDTIGTCIDIWDQSHWALGGATREHFEANLDLHLPGREVNIIEHDMFTVDLDLIPPNVNVYFFDGPHGREAQYQAFVYYDRMFANQFVALVDDWNNIEVKEETQRAFRDLRYTVEAEWKLPGLEQNNRDEKRWWNGLYVAIVRKP